MNVSCCLHFGCSGPSVTARQTGSAAPASTPAPALASIPTPTPPSAPAPTPASTPTSLPKTPLGTACQNLGLNVFRMAFQILSLDDFRTAFKHLGLDVFGTAFCGRGQTGNAWQNTPWNAERAEEAGTKETIPHGPEGQNACGRFSFVLLPAA